jgi:hypothetical protein
MLNMQFFAGFLCSHRCFLVGTFGQGRIRATHECVPLVFYSFLPRANATKIPSGGYFASQRGKAAQKLGSQPRRATKGVLGLLLCQIEGVYEKIPQESATCTGISKP